MRGVLAWLGIVLIMAGFAGLVVAISTASIAWGLGGLAVMGIGVLVYLSNYRHIPPPRM